jgi:hypothetical protein
MWNIYAVFILLICLSCLVLFKKNLNHPFHHKKSVFYSIPFQSTLKQQQPFLPSQFAGGYCPGLPA